MSFDAPSVYADLLSSVRLGYALFNPDPGLEAGPNQQLLQSEPVAPGDVGYVTAHGAFRRLFNVHLPANDPHQTASVPEYFQHIPIAPRKRQVREFRPQVLRSVSRKWVHLSAGGSL